MGITQTTTRTEPPSDRQRIDVTDFSTDQVAAFAGRRETDRVYFERKGSSTYLVTE